MAEPVLRHFLVSVISVTDPADGMAISYAPIVYPLEKVLMQLQKIAFAAAVASISTAAMAEGWRFAPITEPGFKMEPTLAATVGSVKPKDGESATAVGLDFNFNCGLLQSPDNRMRTHLSFSRVDEASYEATNIELSPRYTVPIGEGLSAGVGPSLGVVSLDVGGNEERLFAVGLAGGVNYRMGAFYAGADLRLQRTREKNGFDYDNWAATAKLGINF